MNWTKTKPETKNCMTCETILEIIKAILEYVKGKIFSFFSYYNYRNISRCQIESTWPKRPVYNSILTNVYCIFKLRPAENDLHKVKFLYCYLFLLLDQPIIAITLAVK